MFEWSEIKEKIYDCQPLVFVSLFVALVFVPGLLALCVPQDFLSIHFLWRDLFLWVGAMVLALLLLLTGGFKAFRLTTRSVLFLFFSMYMVFQIFSAIYSAQSHFAVLPIVRDLALFVWAMAALMLWQHPKGKTYISRAILLMSAAVVVAFVYQIYSFVQEKDLSYVNVAHLRSAAFFSGLGYPFFNGNILASFLMPITVAALAARHFKWVKVPVFLLVFLVLAVLASGSKAAWAVLFLVPLGMYLFSYMGLRRSFYFCIGFSLSLFICLYLSFNQRSFQKSMFKGKSFVYDTSSGMRPLMWRGVLRAVFDKETVPIPSSITLGRKLNEEQDRPQWKRMFMGFGPGTYVAQSSAYRDKEYHAHVNAVAADIHPHSSLFSFLFDTGVAGLFLGVSLFIAMMVILLRHTRLQGEAGQMAKCLLCVAVGLSLHSFVSVAPHYFEHRLLWVLVFSGAAYLELKTKNYRYDKQKVWPEEFAGPASAIVVLVIVALCFKGSVISYKRIQGLCRLSEMEETASLAFADKHLQPLEKALFENGEHWVDARSLEWMNKCLSLRRNAANQQGELGLKFRQKTVEHAEDIWKKAPHYGNASMIYGQLAWDLYRKWDRYQGQQGVDRYPLAGHSMKPVDVRRWAIDLLRHHVKKGESDVFIFEIVERDPELKRILLPLIKEHHIIFNDFFSSRVEYAHMRFPLKLLWVMIHHKDKGEGRKKVLRTIENVIDQIPQDGSRFVICHRLAEIYLYTALDRDVGLNPALWKLLKVGGPSLTEEHKAMNPYLEIIRLALFADSEIWKGALEELERKEKAENPKKMVKYPVLFERLKIFLIKGQKIDKNK